MTENGETLEARVQRLEDLEAIGRLFRDYRRFLDGKDFSSYSQLFATNGRFGGVHGAAKGAEAIRALVEGMVGTDLRESKGDDLHLVTNDVIELNGDHATAEVTWAYIVRGDDGRPVLHKVGHYNDTLVREDGRWKFEHRIGTTDIFE
jgi:uncharacterized protein (TIGR02246 family)